jgi:ketosteroid isomerase-like protein
MKNTQQLIEQFLQHVGENNPEKIASSFAENIDWYIFESSYQPWTGKRSKRSELPELFNTLFSAFIPGQEKFEINKLFVDGNEAALFGSSGRVVKATGKSFDTPFCMRFTLENELITKFFMYEETRLIEKAFVK